MKNRKFYSRVISALLCVMMVFTSVPVTTFAKYNDTTLGADGYYKVISQSDYTLVPGAATETEMVLNNSDGTRRQVVHVMEVDPSNPNVSIVPGYYGIDKDVTLAENQTDSKLTDMAAYYEDELGYNVVGGMNTDLTYTSNAPRILVYNGEVISEGLLGNGKTQSYLGVYKNEDGTCYCEVHPIADFEADKENLWQAVGVSFGMVVKDGELVTKTVERTSSPASRSMVGVKEDGTLVICLVDGRADGYSVGLSNYEEGEMMLALGCKWAANCDGGGSSTFITQREGEDSLTMRSRPSDGSERPTLHGVFVVSNASATGIFDHTNIDADYDYFAPNTTYTFGAQGIDTNGYAVDIPSEVKWTLSDNSFGTIENGKFVSNGKLGDVDIQMELDGQVVGNKSIHIVNPDSIEFANSEVVLPYGRSISMDITAAYGVFDVYYQASSFDWTVSDDKAGVLDGLNFVGTEDESVTGVTITAEYKYAEFEPLVLQISYGKGSEILYDFEDKDISEWLGLSDARQWLIDNGVTASPLLQSNPIGGQFSFGTNVETMLATEENGGQVRNGKYSLGVELDYTDIDFADWTYAIFYNIGGPTVLRDTANGKNATTFGMWTYIPEGAPGLAMQLTIYKGDSAENLSGTQVHFYFTTKDGTKKNLNSCTEADIPESRWVYCTADISGYNYVSLMDPKGSSYREPAFIRFYVKTTEAKVMNFYFDDFTLDYSSAVDDREAPIISNIAYATEDTAITLKDGAEISANSMTFSATVGDDTTKSNYTGIDYATGKIYIDGIAVDDVTASNGSLYTNNKVKLTNGTHTVTFEIKDNLGNTIKESRTIKVGSDSLVSLSGHNDLDNTPEYDSVYYVDINTSDIESIDSVTTTLKLQTANTWELDHMIVAEGFEATYEYNEVSKLATVTVEKVGNVTLTGEQTLVSIPVRVWSWNGINYVTGEASTTPEKQFATGYCPIVTIECEVVSSTVGFVENAYSGYWGSFGGEISVATNLNDNINAWHYHTETDVDDVEASCTTDGYTGRTYCEECGSVVDWGTTVSKTGHKYEVVDGKLQCDCGAVYDKTGLVTIDGNGYYVITGSLVKGWQQIGEDWYYFDTDTYKAVSTYNNGKVTYEFDEDGKVKSGVWYHTSEGSRYYYGPAYYKGTPSADRWETIDGKSYCFNKDGYCLKNYHYVDTTNSSVYKWYNFGEDGALVEEWDYTGTYTLNGDLYYLVDGVSQHGMYNFDGAYYYFGSSNYYRALTNTTYKCNDNHKLLPVGNYTFGADGKMVDNAMYTVDDVLYYYVLGQVATDAGTVEIGGKTYQVDEAGKVIYTGTLTDASGVERYYAGGVVSEPVKNGVIDDYFYIDGVKVGVYYGLVEYEGNFYYVDAGAKIIKGARKYVNKSNGLTFADGTAVPNAYFYFDEDGKMIINNGVVDDYFYINGSKVGAYYGLVEYEGDFYYVDAGAKIIKGARKYVNKSNGLTFADGTAVPNAYFEFDEDGKMIVKNGIIDDYFYINGSKVSVYYGLVEYEGNFYYVDAGAKIIKGARKYVNKSNGLTFADGTAVPNAYFEFDEDGKMIVKNGIIDDYFYINGSKVGVYYGLVEYEGNFYYVDAGAKIIKGARKYVNKSNGLTFDDGTAVPNAYFYFDEEGKMIID